MVGRRLVALVQTLRTAGVRATWLALRARQHGAVQNLFEFAWLVRLVSRQRAQTVLEIGTERGGSFWAWCRVASNDATVVSIDFPGREEWDAELRRYRRVRQAQRLIRTDSHDPETVARVGDLRGRVDFLFIDGDHRYQGVRADFEAYAPFVKSGGLIAFHDIAPNDDPLVGSEVDLLWNELRKRYETEELIHHADRDDSSPGIGVIHWHGTRDIATLERFRSRPLGD